MVLDRKQNKKEPSNIDSKEGNFSKTCQKEEIFSM